MKKKKKFLHLLARLVLPATIYFVWYDRDNRVFHQIYQFYQDICEESFELVRSCLIEVKPRYHILVAFKSIRCLLISWDFIASRFLLFCRNWLTDCEILMNRLIVFWVFFWVFVWTTSWPLLVFQEAGRPINQLFVLVVCIFP